MFYICVFFWVPNWPKIGIILGLGLSSTFGPPPSHILPGDPTLGYIYPSIYHYLAIQPSVYLSIYLKTFILKSFHYLYFACSLCHQNG